MRLLRVGLPFSVLGAWIAVAACHGTAEPPPKYPAFPFTLPVLIDNGGPKMTSPNLVVFVAPDDPQKPEVVAALDYLRSSDYWATTTAEYGIGPIGSVTVQDPPAPFPDTVTQGDIARIVSTYARDSRFGGGGGGLDDAGLPLDGGGLYPGTYHTDTLYVVVLPGSTTVSDVVCDERGNHDFVYATATDDVPYALTRSDCPDPLAPETVSLVHEIVEAATDPFVQGAPAVLYADNLAWTAANSNEVVDLCNGLPAQFDTNPPMLVQGASSSPLMFPSVWSNRLAKLGVDPCVPSSSVSPRVFAAAFPETPDTVAISPGLSGPGVNIALQATTTLSLEIASDRPTQAIAVMVGDMAPVLVGPGTTELFANVDRPTANNGDVLKLIVSRRVPPSIPGLTASVLAIKTSTDDGGTGFFTYLVVGGPD